MFLIFCTMLFVFVEMQRVPLYKHPRDPELKNDNINNCYDADGNVVVCPYNSNDPPQPDDAISCLPDEPTGGLGPTNNMVRKQSGKHIVDYESDDCYTQRSCKRQYYVANDEIVEDIYEARFRCNSRKMRLVSIENSWKWGDVIDAIRCYGDRTTSYFTSGKRDGTNSNSFSWGTGCPFSFTNWGYGENGARQPDNYANKEDCVEIVPGLGWNDYPCTDGKKLWRDYKKSYICESFACWFR